jgi:hypothetical protein
MNKITNFYSTANKNPGLSEEVTEKTEVPKSSTSTAGTSEMATTTSNDWPSCWSLEQKITFVQNMNGYMFQVKKLAVRVVKRSELSVFKKNRNENI